MMGRVIFSLCFPSFFPNRQNPISLLDLVQTIAPRKSASQACLTGICVAVFSVREQAWVSAVSRLCGSPFLFLTLVEARNTPHLLLPRQELWLSTQWTTLLGTLTIR